LRTRSKKIIENIEVLIYAIKNDIHFVASIVLHNGNLTIMHNSTNEIITSKTFHVSNYEKITVHKNIKAIKVNIISDEINFTKTLIL